MNIKKITSILFLSVFMFVGANVVSADSNTISAISNEKTPQTTERNTLRKKIPQEKESLFEKYRDRVRHFISPNQKQTLQLNKQQQTRNFQDKKNRVRKILDKNKQVKNQLKDKAKEGSRFIRNRENSKRGEIRTERREQRKIKLNERTKEIIQKVSLRITKAFKKTLERFSQVEEKITQRVALFEEKGFNMTQSKELLSVVPEKIVIAQQKIDNLGTGLSDLANSENPREAFIGLREKIKDIRVSIKEVRKSLVDVIRSIKNSIRLKLQKDNIANQQIDATTTTTATN